MDDIARIEKRLASIESLLQRMPEIQAAAFLQMLDEYNAAKLTGKPAKELWVIPSPDQR